MVRDMIFSSPAGMEPDAAIGAAFALTAGSLVLFGHLLAGAPLSLLGTNSGAGFSTRVWGFDSSRGEFSSLATVLIFSPLLLLLLYNLEPLAGLVAISFLAVLVFWCIYGMHASHPGGPRKHRILREPQWEDREFHVPRGWRCAVAEESHALTEASAESGLRLTGEPAGRQTWHRTEAAGLEEASFNPSVNPNPNDSVWRAQRVAAWESKGGKIPDESWVPKNSLDALRKVPRPPEDDASRPLHACTPTSTDACTPANTRLRSSANPFSTQAMSWYEVLQSDDGHWAGDYGGPHFLMGGLVVVWYVTGAQDNFLSPDQREAMSVYLRAHQQLDGGWGMHIESPSTMFGSCMCYIALRLLGTAADDPAAVKGSAFIKSHGGGLYTGSWAKFYMCLLGAMDWDGHNVIPPEMWLLPQWFPFHPARMWCHSRMVYVPMGYLYGVKFVYSGAETDPLVQALRNELYCEKYSQISWPGTADLVADIDNYSPTHPVMKLGNWALNLWEAFGGGLRRVLRSRGLAFVRDYMHAEDEQTNYVCIGPVNKVPSMLSTKCITSAFTSALTSALTSAPCIHLCIHLSTTPAFTSAFISAFTSAFTSALTFAFTSAFTSAPHLQQGAEHAVDLPRLWLHD